MYVVVEGREREVEEFGEMFSLSALSDAQLQAYQRLISLLAQLAKLPITVEHLVLDTTMDHPVVYRTTNAGVEALQELHFLADGQPLLIKTSFSPDSISFVLGETLEVVISPQKANKYALVVKKMEDKLPQWEISATLQFSSLQTGLQLEAKGTIKLSSLQLMEHIPLEFDFQGKQTITVAGETDFSLSGEVVHLSEIL
jgi:hypothetical protein